MAKQYKVIVNTGKGGDNQIVDVSPGWGRGAQPVRIKALAGAKYQLQEIQRNQQTAPEHVKVKRVGKDLWVVFEGQRDADLIIEDYYEVMTTPSNNLIGRAENGSFYEYIPEDPNVQGLVPNLREGATPINVALGGAEVSGAGAAIAVVGAAFGGWGLIGGLAASVAAGAVVGTLINNNKKTTPSIALSIDTPLVPGQSSTIRFNLSEDSTDFKLEDISVTGGTLSNFQGSGKSYTATFTPTAGATHAEVRVDSGKFSNASGEVNEDGAEANNAVVMIDNTSPTIAVNADVTSLPPGQTTSINFTLSEDSTDFSASDVIVTGGTLSNFQGSGRNYTATFTPTPGVSNAEIKVNSDQFKDAVGNYNKDSGESNNALQLSVNQVIGTDATPPTIVVNSDKTTLSGTQTATIRFTLSEASTDFTESDVTVIGGSLSNFQGSGANYTATFTPTAGATSAAVVVGSYTFRDASDNLSKDGAETNNAVSLTINSTPTDTTPPTIIVASDKTTLSSTQTATINFTLSEASTDFTASDVTVIGGTLSNFLGSGVNYTATFTPTAGATSAAVMVSSVLKQVIKVGDSGVLVQRRRGQRAVEQSR